MSPTYVIGKNICVIIIIGTKTRQNLQAERICNTTLPIFDPTLFVIIINLMKIIVMFANSTAYATPITSHLNPINRQPTVSMNSNNRIKNWYLTNAKLLKKQSHKRPSILNTKANERTINTGNKFIHSAPKNNRIKKLLLNTKANASNIEKMFI